MFNTLEYLEELEEQYVVGAILAKEDNDRFRHQDNVNIVGFIRDIKADVLRDSENLQGSN